MCFRVPGVGTAAEMFKRTQRLAVFLEKPDLHIAERNF
jgi:hypothetical protein